ncbi:MAG: hypothetical protein WCQ95_09715 [Bacteroidota bacterium]
MRAIITIKHKRKESYNNDSYWEIFRDMKLEPFDILVRNTEINDEDFNNNLISRFKEDSIEILNKIPQDTQIQKNKIKKETDAIIYFSHLDASDTDFMVVKRVNGSLKFRLTNQRIEKLQEGCSELIENIKEYNKKHDKFVIYPEIDVFEHGLEDATIYGEIINRGILGRFAYIVKNETKEFIIVCGTLSLFFTIYIITSSMKNMSQTFYESMGRLETGFLTATVISILSMIHAYVSLVPPIKWTLKLKNNKK